MSYTVTLLPGDGIGPEVTAAARTVIEATGFTIDWDVQEAGGDVIEKYGTALPEPALDSIRRNGVALKGPITTPVGKGFSSVNVKLRKELKLYANYRPAKTMPGVKSRYDNVDLIVIRENTEGLYSGLEHEVIPGVIESLRVITYEASERIVRFAFETARQYGRKKVTVVHKANILKLSDGLFLDVARVVAKDYHEIELEEYIVDATAMRLVMRPESFDVLVMENLFGDIISDLTSGLVGGLGVAPSANIGTHCAVFEAVHGSAPDIAGQGIANPTALILSGALMLRHLRQLEAAANIEHAVHTVLAEGKTITGDLGGNATTSEYAAAVAAVVERLQDEA
ncbi:Isocitrate dehydrogenase [NADP] [Symmachiella macrocystis]|uniref:Isocitrate dehydrogenase [NADP] n=1 Tax=Symmachiella macrocystis TaxID=2527985 RepID=A0A5C6BDL6_9PLAN|nr:isocitrate/isopropylmalate dehydrogenase family protein [Symmachiella macrocystis]TWU09379.1 Isocitrate dehydrogenase [NADP] [Symmachiella macrocystis]